MHGDQIPAGAPTVDRRRALVLLGGAGLVAVAAGCSSGGSGTAAAPSAAPGTGTGPDGDGAAGAACTLTPEQTEGPYYLDDDLVRRDLTEDRDGVPLALAVTVVDVDGCRPIEGAAVDVWHCDAAGVYSGVDGVAGTFLRGTQPTDASGLAEFTTIQPGWYPGRAVHIHVKVHAGGDAVHTGQLYFDEAAVATVYEQGPYADRGRPDTPNARDAIFSQGGSATVMTPTGDGSGLRAAVTLGVAPS
ncbi:MAG: intradiol ring-cleavage dioxygenase [Acidimicrobiales bacterium]|nr:intradiol ring-cleavage dioxygenase [Acidimicrobiales bacterium]